LEGETTMPDDRLTALVTGAGRGIGHAIMQRLLADGYAVVAGEVAPRGIAALEEEARQYANVGEDLLVPAALDVTNLEQIAAAVQTAQDRWGGLDVLVNNAGRNRAADSLSASAEDWDWVLDTNLKAVFFCSQAAARLMAEAGGGSIVNISSTSASGIEGNAPYSASKAGVIGLTRSMATELGPSGIRVNAVAPGTTLSDWVVRNRPEEELQASAETNPLRRNAEPEDIAAVVAFLASDDARHVTGQVISASGGRWMP
jgi:3-oxoacyl-[acyl-carrier protein] reductase